MWRKRKTVRFRWHKLKGPYPTLPRELETVILCFENDSGTRDYITAFQRNGRWYNQNTGDLAVHDYDGSWSLKAWKRIEPID
jgi:hypothetical protein